MDQRVTVAGLPEGLLRDAFARALEAAAAFRGATSPNPPVGCAVLDATGNVLAVAAHEKAGEGHAEARALAACRMEGSIDRAHSIVVTLEPCNHTGRTPPCCDAILASPVRHVWIGSTDPNPGVKGGGAARLAAAGLTVRMMSEIHAGLAEQSAKLIGPFSKRVRTGLPWVTVKQANDESGSMIPPAGQKTFTSDSSLTLAHELRKRADAIITGSGTVLRDDPHFTVRRVADHAGKVRDLFILDRRRRVSAEYLAAATARGFRPHLCDYLGVALQAASVAGALEVLVEAGPAVTAHVLESGAWDEHFIIHRNGSGPGLDRVEHRLRQTTAKAE